MYGLHKYVSSLRYYHSMFLCQILDERENVQVKFHMGIELSLDYTDRFHFTMMPVHFYLQKILTRQVS